MKEILDALVRAFWWLFWLAVVGVVSVFLASLWLICQIAVWIFA